MREMLVLEKHFDSAFGASSSSRSFDILGDQNPSIKAHTAQICLAEAARKTWLNSRLRLVFLVVATFPREVGDSDEGMTN